MEKIVDIIYIVDGDNSEDREAIMDEILEMIKTFRKFINHPKCSFKNITVQTFNDELWLGAIADKNQNRTIRFRMVETRWNHKVLERNFNAIKETQNSVSYAAAYKHLGFDDYKDFSSSARTILVPCLSGYSSNALVEAVARKMARENAYVVLDPSDEFEGWSLYYLATDRLQCQYGLRNDQVDSDFLSLSRKLLKRKDRWPAALLGGFLAIAAVFLSTEARG